MLGTVLFRRSTIIVLLCCGLTTGAETQEECPKPTPDYVKAFSWHGRQYEVRFAETGEQNVPWPEDLVMRWRGPGAKWQIASRIEGVRLDREVRLPAERPGASIGLVVTRPGGSAQFVSVVQVQEDPPTLKLLLNDELDKGGYTYRFDSQGRLIGLRFTYMAWHIAPDNLRGHAFTAVNVGWIPGARRFRTGPVYVDTEREQEASLAEILTAIGSDEILDVEVTHDEGYRTYTYTYKPTGLLLRKTPPELRSAAKVRAVVRYTDSPDTEPFIAEIGAVKDQ